MERVLEYQRSRTGLSRRQRFGLGTSIALLLWFAYDAIPYWLTRNDPDYIHHIGLPFEFWEFGGLAWRNVFNISNLYWDIAIVLISSTVAGVILASEFPHYLVRRLSP